MEWYFVLLLIFLSLICFMLTGMPVFMAFMTVNVIGVFLFWGGESGLGQLILTMKNSVKSFVLLPFPLFILLGEVLFRSGMAGRAIDVVDTWLGRVPGRLGLLGVGAGVVSSTLSGSGVASTAMLAATLTPDMEKRGYKKPMSLGPILGSGGIAMIIPPSADIVLLASLASLSVGKLLMAGVFPGILMGLLYAGYIIIRCYLQPSIAPPYTIPHIPLAKKIRITLINVVPIAIIIFLVIGVILIGIATPSEAAALGALGAFILAACYRSLTWEVVKVSITNATKITIMLLSILLGAMAFSQILAYTGCVKGLIEFTTTLPLPPTAILVGMLFTVLFLGCFMDEIALMMMILPIYMPIVTTLGFDPVWFAILLLINFEMALTTPPFGMILFVMKGSAPPDTKMTDIYKAAVPFLICDAVAIALIMMYPKLALWLPQVMK
ncbi:TRAP transporter large permease subunit [Desulfobacula sp.]|uniref:TRAP transporter large permease n=1 Tax=Desulfobacula sp. TaxID=2593537 RepID=UPI00260C700B|nr:TRAP transporter large permease subunit [Desulfobacula sp.]